MGDVIAEQSVRQSPTDLIRDLTPVLRDYIEEAAHAPAFCGTLVDELRDEKTDELLAVRIVFCDMQNGVRLRRV